MLMSCLRNVSRIAPCAGHGGGYGNGLRADCRVVIGGGGGSRLITTSSEAKQDVLTTSKLDQQQQQNVDKKGFTFVETVRFGQRMKKFSRALSTANRSVPLATNATAVSKAESREFMSVFPDLVRDLTEKARKYDSQDAAKWFAKALQYNVPRGKKNRGLVTVLAYKTLLNGELTEDNLRRVQFLGWCVEMLQSMQLITDDIMDQSETRRGQPCWYKHEDVGLTAINDSIMIENSIFFILKKYFSDQPYYVELIELFHEAMMITSIGQSLDLQAAKKSADTFTMDQYKTIVHHKTAFYTFYLPVALAMRMAGYTDPEVFRQAKTILLEMGYFFQVQDDFLDCFGNPEVTGKIGTDIQDNKCTWLAVLCMQRATDEQKLILKECYGQQDPSKVEQVKELYEDLGLPHTFAVYEEKSYNMILTHIQQTSRGMPHGVFTQIMDKIYRRES